MYNTAVIELEEILLASYWMWWWQSHMAVRVFLV